MPTYKNKSVQFVQLLLSLVLCLFLAGCLKPCPPQTLLPVEPYPVLLEVKADEEGKISGEQVYNVLENNVRWQGQLDKCNNTILKYNSAVHPPK